ncbi:MAG: hypothetical protein AAGC72_08195 [Planctomycetota bacterium]
MTSTTTPTTTDPAAAARDSLDAHMRETIAWHFSEETGTPYWISYAKEHGIDPSSIRTFDDLVAAFDHFDADTVLRYIPHDQMIPRAFAGKPYNVFETGGTTGMPKQRLNWGDFQHDYTQFSKTLRDDHFPRGGNWLMIGPTGPRRLRLAIEHLAHCRDSSVYFVDLDPRWVKRVIREGQPQQAKAYMAHAIDQAMTILRHREVTALFTTPKLLEALSERMSLTKLGIKGAFVGGTTMDPQYTRFLIEEVCEQPDGDCAGTAGVGFYPTYGNTLMGVAPHRPNIKENHWQTTYYCPQPRAVLRVVDPDDTAQTLPYGAFGRVELTTLTKELFMPRFLERDEARRVEPWLEKYPWDGVSEVRPFGASTQKIVEGVY